MNSSNNFYNAIKAKVNEQKCGKEIKCYAFIHAIKVLL